LTTGTLILNASSQAGQWHGDAANLRAFLR
jgi:hypothetical protein